MNEYIIRVNGKIVSRTPDVVLHQLSLDYHHVMGNDPTEERIKHNGN